ncbi:MAG: cystathionine gamma-synthase [Acuticoccus sp.]
MTQRDKATIAATAAGAHNAGGGVVGPLELSTTFERDSAYDLPPSGDIYRRPDNATVREAERVIAALEGGTDAVLFPSGLAAMAAAMRVHLDRGVLLQEGAYYGTETLLGELAGAAALPLFAAGDLAALEGACATHRPGMVVIETPSNPLLTVTSIADAAGIAHRYGAILVVDSSAATPILTQPLALGADIVMHSATKGLNGHSDVLAGVLVAGERGADTFAAARTSRSRLGAMVSPFDAMMLTRGMRTLALRVAAMSQSALHLATLLDAQPKVRRVFYPGLPDHPGHAVAAAQMSGGFGGLMSFEVEGGAEAALALAGRLSLIKRATSLGGVESMIEHRASIEPPHRAVPPGLLRLSVGIEAVGDLADDLLGALGN